MANAKKQPYPVTVTDTKGNLVPSGVSVVIDQDSSDSILKTFGAFKSAQSPSEVAFKPVEVDLEDPLVKKAIEAAVKDRPVNLADPSVVQAISDAADKVEPDLESDIVKTAISEQVDQQTSSLKEQLEKLSEAAGAFVLELASEPVDAGKAEQAETALKALLDLND